MCHHGLGPSPPPEPVRAPLIYLQHTLMRALPAYQVEPSTRCAVQAPSSTMHDT
eukprot:CAMPEP_0202910422 /NCGR_PEP_ID=MMETSP1392-20130828/52046_1 /ASSEMBLY_ACC=CAM_ASM_000868 /TAXON_ID=225041 /ORGANISM="Chlamydomonas chlamydogama, Strain SAG 11-48b" /LENGTH=53 /DNA_ID=CAMNT_0049600535 /DNA_START=88 /DNA_END=246 /DNA_ORIENTATION=-